MSPVAKPARPWITKAEAARLACLDVRRIDDLAHRGLIRTRDVPGVSAKFSRASVEALVASWNAPAAE